MGTNVYIGIFNKAKNSLQKFTGKCLNLLYECKSPRIIRTLQYYRFQLNIRPNDMPQSDFHPYRGTPVPARGKYPWLVDIWCGIYTLSED